MHVIEQNENEINDLAQKVTVAESNIQTLMDSLFAEDITTDKLENESHTEYFLRRIEEGDDALIDRIIGDIDLPEGEKAGEYLKELIEANQQVIADHEASIMANETDIQKLMDTLFDEEATTDMYVNETHAEYFLRKIQEVEDELMDQIIGDKDLPKGEKAGEYLELADINDAYSGNQHVNIDLDIGCEDDSTLQAFEIFASLEWWHYLIIGLAIVLVSIGGLAFSSCKDRSVEDRMMPIIPY